MKQSTKRLIWALFIAFIMFGSSIGFIINFFPVTRTSEENQQQEQVPTQFILDNYVESENRIAYLQRGVSLLEFHYYEDCCPSIQAYIESIPQLTGFQVVVQKIKDSDAPRIKIESALGEAETNVTKVSEILPPLCNVLIKPPLECGLLKIQTNRTE